MKQPSVELRPCDGAWRLAQILGQPLTPIVDNEERAARALARAALQAEIEAPLIPPRS